jgi:hypothetical protein
VPEPPLRDAMVRHGYNVSSLSRALGCSRGTVHDALAGRRLLSDQYRAKAKKLGFADEDFEAAPPSPLVAAAHELAERSRAEQGLPSLIEDPDTLDAVARILARALLDCPPRAKR